MYHNEICYIYRILDSENKPVYIGKSVDADNRVAMHVREAAKGKTQLSKWIRSQLKPIKYDIVARCMYSQSKEVERIEIQSAIKDGYVLFNRNKVKEKQFPDIKKVKSSVKDYSAEYSFMISIEQQKRIMKTCGEDVYRRIKQGQGVDKLIDSIIEIYKKEEATK